MDYVSVSVMSVCMCVFVCVCVCARARARACLHPCVHVCSYSYHPYSTTEVVEHACSITTLQLGETLGGVSRDMDTYTYRTPLGVCAGITP